MYRGRAETTVGIPRHQDPNTSYPAEWDEDAWTDEFLSVEDSPAEDQPTRHNKGARNRRRFL